MEFVIRNEASWMSLPADVQADSMQPIECYPLGGPSEST